MNEYKESAAAFVAAIRAIAGKEPNMGNLENYLSHHFGAWLEKFANTPEGIASELREFAEMDV